MYYSDGRNEFFVAYSPTDVEWLHWMKSTQGDAWASATYSEVNEATNFWLWNGKLHRTVRSLIIDGTSEDLAVATTEDGGPRLSVTLDQDYPSRWPWAGYENNSIEFTLELDPDSFHIRGYTWVMRADPKDNSGCLVYEETATDFTLGVDMGVPEAIQQRLYGSE